MKRFGLWLCGLAALMLLLAACEATAVASKTEKRAGGVNVVELCDFRCLSGERCAEDRFVVADLGACQAACEAAYATLPVLEQTSAWAAHERCRNLSDCDYSACLDAEAL